MLEMRQKRISAELVGIMMRVGPKKKSKAANQEKFFGA